MVSKGIFRVQAEILGWRAGDGGGLGLNEGKRAQWHFLEREG
jgi:hypothetical protein